MEAILATDESAEDAAARARMNVVYDVLNRLDSPNFFIGMNLSGFPETPPPTKQIKSFLVKHLAQLNPDEIANLLKTGDLDDLPHWHYEYKGWKIDFFPIPKSPSMRGKGGVRPLGMQFHGVHFLDSRVAIRDAIVAKARRYGDLDLPYVIAVNALGEDVDRIDIMEALFGKEQFTVRLTQSGPSEPKMTRVPDGAWVSKSGPRYKRVSAILVAAPVLPWNVPRARICLYHNPWARRPYTSELTRLPQAVPQDNTMKWQDGESLSTIFGLPLWWPEA